MLLEENIDLFNRADIDRDRMVNIADLAIVSENWLRSSLVQG